MRPTQAAAGGLSLSAREHHARGEQKRGEFPTIDLMPFVQRVRDRLADLEAARAAVENTSDILGGTPVLKETRVPVYDVATSAAAGRSLEEIRATWPNLDADMVRLASLFTEANPPRGRPRGSTGMPKGAFIMTNKRVPQRRVRRMRFLVDECLSPVLAKTALREVMPDQTMPSG